MMGFMTNVMPFGRRDEGLMHHTAASVRPHTDVLIHVNEVRDEDQCNEVATALKEIEGVLSAEFSPRRGHLLIVWYDTHCTSSREILDELHRQGLHVQLIGPV